MANGCVKMTRLYQPTLCPRPSAPGGSRISISPVGITASVGHESQSVIVFGSIARLEEIKKPEVINSAMDKAQKRIEFIKLSDIFLVENLDITRFASYLGVTLFSRIEH